MYEWKDGSRIKADAEKVGHELSEIEKKYGMLTPGVVLAEVRDNEELELYQYFAFNNDWDDEVAAEKWRFKQAGHIIRSVIIVKEFEEDGTVMKVRAFESVSTERKNVKVYVNIDSVMADETMRNEVMASVLSAISALRRKIRDYKYLSNKFGWAEEQLLLIESEIKK